MRLAANLSRLYRNLAWGERFAAAARDGLLDAVAALSGFGYDSWLGCEYQPLASAAAGLSWREPLRRRGVLQ